MFIYIYTVGSVSSRSKFVIPCLVPPDETARIDIYPGLTFKVFAMAGLGLGFHKVGRTEPVYGISSMICTMFWMMIRYDNT